MEATTRAKFKVKIRSLAEESRIIKSISRKHKGKWQYVQGVLRFHNFSVVRAEQRATLLAYGFLREIPYKVLENKTNKEIPIDMIVRICQSLARYKIGNSATAKENVTNWCKGILV